MKNSTKPCDHVWIKDTRTLKTCSLCSTKANREDVAGIPGKVWCEHIRWAGNAKTQEMRWYFFWKQSDTGFDQKTPVEDSWACCPQCSIPRPVEHRECYCDRCTSPKRKHEDLHPGHESVNSGKDLLTERLLGVDTERREYFRALADEARKYFSEKHGVIDHGCGAVCGH